VLLVLVLLMLRQSDACDAIRREILMQSAADRLQRDAGSVRHPSVDERASEAPRTLNDRA